MASVDPEEETAVQFVAVTHAQDTLRFAYGKESWAAGWRVKPGGQVQPAPPSHSRDNEDESALFAASPPGVSSPRLPRPYGRSRHPSRRARRWTSRRCRPYLRSSHRRPGLPPCQVRGAPA